MRFRVEIPDEARRDIDAAYEYIRRHGPGDPVQWFRGIESKLLSLQDFADWSGFAPEDNYSREEIRQILYGPFRILYLIRDEIVRVLTVRHGARRFLSAGEIDRLAESNDRESGETEDNDD